MTLWGRMLLLGILASLSGMGSALAQNTGGVPGPQVTPGERQAEWRVAIDPGSDGGDARTAMRLHYQQALTDTFRLRGIITGSDAGPGGFDLTQYQVQALWQFADASDGGVNSALRFDYIVTDGSASPDSVRLGWTAEWPLRDDWTFRTVAFGSLQTGDNREDGVFLEARTALIRRIAGGHSLQVQSFSQLGSTANLPGFDGQNHALGPLVSYRLSSHWSLDASALFGISDAADDAVFRLFLGYRF